MTAAGAAAAAEAECRSWLTTIDSSAQVWSLDVAIGPGGTTTLGGSFFGAIRFDGLPPLEQATPEPVYDEHSFTVSSGGTDGFLIAFDARGGVDWRRRIGGVDDDETVAAGLNAAGRVYAAGNITGQAQFGSVELTARGSHAYGAAFDPDGKALAAQLPKDWSSVQARRGTVDAQGNLYVLGMRSTPEDDCEFDDEDRPCLSDLFLAKFAPDGSPRWSTRTSGDAQAQSRAIAVDASGKIHIAGAFSGALDIGGESLLAAGESDLLLATYNPDGTLAGAQRAATGNAAPIDLATDRDGNRYVVGTYWDPTTFGTDTELPMPNLGGFGGVTATDGLFIARFAPSGALDWVEIAEDPDIERGWLDIASIGADAAGNSYVIGWGYQWQDSGDVIEAVDRGRFFLAQFDPSGQVAWVERADRFEEYGTRAGDLAVDDEGNVHVASFAAPRASIGGLTLEGESNMFVWRRCRTL